MKIPKNKYKCLGAGIIALLVSAEVGARVGLGLGDPLLYETGPDYSYRVAPDQDLQRFGNRVFYNGEGLRSGPIDPQPSSGTTRILCIGDSITYGGAQTDQTETYPYQLQSILNRQDSQKFQVLNASAGGWGIANVEGYLRQEGIYHSQIVVLELGSHDLFQPKASSDLVGHSVSFPDHKPLLALQEGIVRYFIPRFLPGLTAPEPNLQAAPTQQDLERNLASLESIAELVKARRAKLIILLVEQPQGLEPQTALATLSKKKLAHKAKDLNLLYANSKQAFDQAGSHELFRDGLHPNSQGNSVMARVVAKQILNDIEVANGINSNF